MNSTVRQVALNELQILMSFIRVMSYIYSGENNLLKGQLRTMFPRAAPSSVSEQCLGVACP